MDFARFRFPWGVRYALLVVLGYSRLLWCRFYPSRHTATLYEGLEDTADMERKVPATKGTAYGIGSITSSSRR